MFTLLAMTLERHRAIMTPLALRISKSTLWVAIAAIWVSSSLLALPSAVFSTLHTRQRTNQSDIHFCMLLWPDGAQGKSAWDYG